MPLPAYGVLIGTLNHFTREDPNNYGSWYHGKLYVDTPCGQYEGAVDVSTPSGIKVAVSRRAPSQSPGALLDAGAAARMESTRLDAPLRRD